MKLIDSMTLVAWMSIFAKATVESLGGTVSPSLNFLSSIVFVGLIVSIVLEITNKE